MRLTSTAIVAATLLTACTASDIQTTSGAEYLAQYAPVETQEQAVVQRSVRRIGDDAALVEERVQTLSADKLVRQAAAIEPLLKLPARIGLARIDGGRLTTIPAGENALWLSLAQRHHALGSFVAIDPFVAQYTVRAILPQDRRAHRRDAYDLITQIRLGAARQHADAVLIYEVGTRERRVKGIKGLFPIHALGAAPLPAAPIEKEGVARAFLMDVRNGYPYGTASSSVDLAGLEQSIWGQGPNDAQGIEAKIRITRGLVSEAEKMLGGVLEATAAQRPAS